MVMVHVGDKPVVRTALCSLTNKFNVVTRLWNYSLMNALLFINKVPKAPTL
jgi:hypothetical protein